MPELDRCLAAARREQLAPYVAEPALLFLTEPTGAEPQAVDLSTAGVTRIALTGAAVVAVAAPDPQLIAMLHEESLLQHLVDDLQDLAQADAGTLRLHPEPLAAAEVVDHVAAAHADDTVVVEVTDTGHGIAPDDLAHVFDRSWRADKSRSRGTGGSGLGLAITRHLAELHGGTVTATSTVGRGSTFRLTFPAVDTIT